MKELWTEKYRPNTLDEYVFRDSAQKHQVQGWVDSGMIPHLLFSGAPGVGKTTLAKILVNLLNINEYDVLEINASRENSVDAVREKITNFVATMPFGEFKVVLLRGSDKNDIILRRATNAAPIRLSICPKRANGAIALPDRITVAIIAPIVIFCSVNR